MSKKKDASEETPLKNMFSCVARGGFEPPRTVPKTAVLPLDDRAMSAF
jgi:hypothetical protein